MKKLITIFLTLFMLISTAACQPTPEQDIVVGKDTDRLIENAAKDTSAPFPSDASGCDLYERIGAPETYSAELVSKGGKLTVHVDADVELPDCEIPIYRLRATEFNAEQV